MRTETVHQSKKLIKFFAVDKVCEEMRLKALVDSHCGNLRSMVVDFGEEKIASNKSIKIGIANNSNQKITFSFKIYFSSAYYSSRHRCARSIEVSEEYSHFFQ